MKRLKLPGTDLSVLVPDNQAAEHASFIEARHKVVMAYCAEKGWDRDDLTIEQIMEIRSQDAWKNPLG